MARLRMVTRTVETLEISVQFVDKEDLTSGVKTGIIELSQVVDDDKIKTAIEKEMPNWVVVNIISTHKNTTLLGMPETDFIKWAKPLDEKTRKLLDE